MAGVAYVERLSGTFYRLAEPLREQTIALEIEASLRNLRTRVATATGHLRAEDLAEAPVQGTVTLRGLTERRIAYDLAFVGRDGRRYRLRGEKDLSWLAPVETLVALPFTIGVDQDGLWTEIARGTMRFDVGRDSLRALVRSVRASPF
ncbi:MAG TPA: hypothetical protein VGH28_28740 [Polyangiaceae bacterium]|jgi:hypothetical protein